MPTQNMCLVCIISQLLCDKNNVVILSLIQNLLRGQSVGCMNIKPDGAITGIYKVFTAMNSPFW